MPVPDDTPDPSPPALPVTPSEEDGAPAGGAEEDAAGPGASGIVEAVASASVDDVGGGAAVVGAVAGGALGAGGALSGGTGDRARGRGAPRLEASCDWPGEGRLRRSFDLATLPLPSLSGHSELQHARALGERGADTDKSGRT